MRTRVMLAVWLLAVFGLGGVAAAATGGNRQGPPTTLPPATSVTLPAGTTLMVLKHGQHPMAEIEACQKRLLQSDVTLKGVIFNDVQRAGVSQAYRYGTAAYQYAYGKKKG